MTPYYQDSAVTIYNGDCREILPDLPKVDLVLTDPPYIGLKGGFEYGECGGVAPQSRQSALSIGDPWQASTEWVTVLPPHLGAIVFCAYVSVPEVALAFEGYRRAALLTWYKRNSPPSGKNVPRFTTEFVWCLSNGVGIKWDDIKNTLFDIPKLATGCMASKERFVADDGRALHPTQKPLSLMRALMLGGANTILDPFMGTGTTLRAAKDLGRKATGIEIEEKYCEISAQRMAQEVLDL